MNGIDLGPGMMVLLFSRWQGQLGTFLAPKCRRKASLISRQLYLKWSFRIANSFCSRPLGSALSNKFALPGCRDILNGTSLAAELITGPRYTDGITARSARIIAIVFARFTDGLQKTLRCLVFQANNLLNHQRCLLAVKLLMEYS
ncbi:MAG TPA: hypothetical protein VN496_03390 [Burkholderiales bacterium]|nr:hypothetical protein [Burkholderiales bacterium]